MNKKVYKMYEAPKMEIVEVELQNHLLGTSKEEPVNPDPNDEW